MAEEIKKKKVLIIEDDPEVLEVSSAMLSTAGFTVVPSPDGETALYNLKNDKFDLVVLDIILPKIDGFSVYKTLRSNSNTSNIPVLVVSGRSGMADTFMSCGADGFLAKPVEKDSFIAEAKRLTRNKALLLTDSHHVVEKISRIFEKYDYDVNTVENETSMLAKGKTSKYKCIIAHLSCVSSAPDKFKEIVENLLSYKNPALILYSDSSVKGLEKNSTVAIEEVITTWTRAGVRNFYDSRVVLRPLTVTLKEWLPAE